VINNLKKETKVLKKKAGINRPIVCRNCGKRVGYVKIRTRFKLKMFLYIMLLALAMQFVAEGIIQLIFGF